MTVITKKVIPFCNITDDGKGIEYPIYVTDMWNEDCAKFLEELKLVIINDDGEREFGFTLEFKIEEMVDFLISSEDVWVVKGKNEPTFHKEDKPAVDGLIGELSRCIKKLEALKYTD
jgi:hypothetical protein